MSRASQFITFINAETIPSNTEMVFHYDSISKTPELKDVRKQYRKELKTHPLCKTNLN